MSAPSNPQVDKSAAFSTASFSTVLYGRRAIRSYAPTTVDDAWIRLLLDAAIHAPTAMHQEPWEFVVVQDRRVLREISDRAKELTAASFAIHGRLLKSSGAAGDAIASPLADAAFNIFYDAGTVILICAKPTNGFVAADCWLAAENVMLAAPALDLGTCCIGLALEALNTSEGKTIVKIPEDRQVFVAITVGVPKTVPLPAPRKPAVILNWIR